MTARSFAFLFGLAVACNTSSAFFSLAPKQATQGKELRKYIETEPGTLLDIKLDVGSSDNQSHLFITNLLMELSCQRPDYNHPRMPGMHGPTPQHSSGVYKLNVLKKGRFINMQGSQEVSLDNGVWECCWKEGAPAGSIVCGFNVPETYRRNEACLPRGRIYISFPVFTHESLKQLQVEKERRLDQLQVYAQERDSFRKKFQETDNPILKALHFRNAYAAAEKMTLLPIQALDLLPKEADALAMNDDLCMSPKGHVWIKEDGIAGLKYRLGKAFINNRRGANLAP